MNYRITTILTLLLTLLLTASAWAQTERVLMVLVNGPEAGWPEQDIQRRLEQLLTSRNKFELLPAIEAEMLAEKMNGRFSKAELIEHGLQLDCRYIIWCDITREELTIERGFSLPFLVNQRRVTATLKLEYRVVDCYRGRLLVADEIEKRKYGPSSAQFLDDTDADANLYLGYLERKRLFDELEDDAARTMFAELERIAKQR